MASPSFRLPAGLRSRLRIGVKFSLLLVVLITAVLTVTLGGLRGLGAMKREVDRMYAQNVHHTQRAHELERSLAEAEVVALQLAAADSSQEREDLNARLAVEIVPAVERNIEELTGREEGEEEELELLSGIEAGWEKFLKLYGSGELGERSTGVQTGLDERLARRVTVIFGPVLADAADVTVEEAAETRAASDRAVQSYRDAMLVMLAIGLLSLVAGVLIVIGLVRTVVTRVRQYSSFAGEVAAGAPMRELELRGSDELTELGAALNEMVRRRDADDHKEELQEEFIDMLQVTETEEEAHDLLRRHLVRSLPDTAAFVMNRNNSADRLEATTEVPADSHLAEALRSAQPRSCLAVRFARSHKEDPEREALVKCEICGLGNGLSTCEPLLVGGEVIGSVLVEHSVPLAEEHHALVRNSVGQAAPVLANLRNLAIAEIRAATDALTGLPNSRAARDTLKRMVAQASRTVTPLAAALLDLDHFKQINDNYGHGRGDDVLAAVGEILQASLRESDFVGRYGGEEFLFLLPDTERQGALTVAEKVRAAIQETAVPGVPHNFTASIGIAVLPDDAGDGETLIRHADRALYAAKAKGRNRIEVAAPPGSEAAPTASPAVRRT